MNNDNIILTMQQADEGYFNWGTERLLADDIGLQGGSPVGRNKAITFREFLQGPKPTKFEQSFAVELEKLRKLDNILWDTQTEHIMIVGNIYRTPPYGVELIPTEELLQNYKFCLSYEYYYQKEHTWPRLSSHNEIKVVFVRNDGHRVFCEVTGIVAGIEKNLLIEKKNRLYKDLECMAGHALLGAEVLDYREIENGGKIYKSLRMGLNGILLYGDQSLEWIPEDIFGNSTKVGSKYNVWIDPYDADNEAREKSFKLSCTRLDFPKLPHYPLKKPDQDRLPIVGRVISFNKIGQVLWTIFDRGTWASCVYRNNIDIKKWGPLVKDYLPLGFPAQFTLDLKENSPENSRLFFRGFNPGKLKGRVDTDSEAKDLRDRVLGKYVMVSPYRRDKSAMGVFMTSPSYAGWADDVNIPEALVHYSKSGIFTTEMQVPAIVRIIKKTVVFNVKEALKEELERLQQRKGKQETMRVCAKCLSHVFLTSTGGYPIEYVCHDQKEEERIRENMFQQLTFIIDNIDNNVVEVSMASDFLERFSLLTIPIGGLFPVSNAWKDQNEIWHTTLQNIDVIVLPETLQQGEILNERTPLLYVTADMPNSRIIAAAHHEQFVKPVKSNVRLKAVKEVTPSLWFCTKNQQLVLMQTSHLETLLLRHLKQIYGANFPMMAKMLDEKEKKTSAQCQFAHVACGADYQNLFRGESIHLTIPLSKNTPRVLYYDAVLTASNDELENGPMSWIILTGQIDESGAFLCQRGQAHMLQHSIGNIVNSMNNSSETIVMGDVIDVDDSSVTFAVNNKNVRLSSVEQLHIPIDECAPLPEIFSKGTSWNMRKTPTGYELYNHCPDKLIAYTLIKMNTGGRKLRRHIREWVVLGENGAIAVAEVTDGEEGDTLLMLNDGCYGDVAYVAEAELQIRGYELPVKLVGQDPKSGDLICEPIDRLNIGDNYIVPLELWNWNFERFPMQAITPLIGGACLTKIKKIDEDLHVYLDRRCLIPQCELLTGSITDGTYQMMVKGFKEEGYILEQNDVQVTLPWNEASLCYIENNNLFKKEFLQIGTLLRLQIHHQPDSAVLTASWRSMMGETIERWKKYAEKGESQLMKICHIGT